MRPRGECIEKASVARRGLPIFAAFGQWSSSITVQYCDICQRQLSSRVNRLAAHRIDANISSQMVSIRTGGLTAVRDVDIAQARIYARRGVARQCPRPPGHAVDSLRRNAINSQRFSAG